MTVAFRMLTGPTRGQPQPLKTAGSPAWVELSDDQGNRMEFEDRRIISITLSDIYDVIFTYGVQFDNVIEMHSFSNQIINAIQEGNVPDMLGVVRHFIQEKQST